jgi:hypothetical protein
MPRRGSREVVVNHDGGYWVRSKTNNNDRGRERRRPSTREESPQRPHRSYDDMIIVEDAEHGQTVYAAPPARPRARKERSYSEPQLPPSRSVLKEDRPRRGEPVILERAQSPPKSRRCDRSPTSEKSDSPPPQRCEKSPRRSRRVSFNDEPRRKSEARLSRAAASPPPPPPPYQPSAYTQPAPVQPYYGQSMKEPLRQGNPVTHFGRKLGNAAIFGVGFTGAVDLVNSSV